MGRLRASSDRLQLNVPFSDEQLSAWIDETVAAAGDMKESYIRILLTRGVGEAQLRSEVHAHSVADHHREAAGRTSGACLQ